MTGEGGAFVCVAPHMPRPTHESRLRATLAGELPDRPPLAFWRHWPDEDQRGDALARATVAFQRRHDFDFVKLSPASNYAVAAWGGRSARGPGPVGARAWLARAVREPEDWARLAVRDPRAGLCGEVLEALRLTRAALPASTPVVVTIFNPLAQAKYLAGEETLREHLRAAPDAVEAGLRVIAETTARFAAEACRAGASGVFLAVQHAGGDALGTEAYRRFGEAGDRLILRATGEAWLNVLHLHGPAPLLALADAYPEVAVVNWHAGEAAPGLAEAAGMTRRVLLGGAGPGRPLAPGSPAEVVAAVRAARRATGDRRLIVGAGCVLRLDTPEENLAAVRAALLVPREHGEA